VSACPPLLLPLIALWLACTFAPVRSSTVLKITFFILFEFNFSLLFKGFSSYSNRRNISQSTAKTNSFFNKVCAYWLHFVILQDKKSVKMKTIEINSLLSTIGQNLHTIRNARKETLQSVAADIGITHPIISKIENGRYPNIQLNLLIKLCNHYKVSLQQILGLEVANIFQLTQHNKDGSQKLIGQELSSGYDLYIQQLISENKFLKEQNQQFLDNLVAGK
jgi:transcriptional regulator with XRE-family HTH domain